MGTKISQDLELAFDVGHSSIGWAVLQSRTGVAPVSIKQNSDSSPRVNILAVVSSRLARMIALPANGAIIAVNAAMHAPPVTHRTDGKLLTHLTFFLRAVETKASASRWSCRTVAFGCACSASNGDAKHLLDWTKLWDVLRWYAHNRGYDGNRRWSAQESEAQADDTEKEKNANALMAQHGTQTMQKRSAKFSALNRSATTIFQRKTSASQCCVPRPIVEREVHRLLELHQKNCPPSSRFSEKSF